MVKQQAEAEQVLDSLDDAAGRHPAAAQRQVARRTWRKRMKITFTQPGGDQRLDEVVTRNLSGGGMSFLTSGFFHIGTRCGMQLITADNAWVEMQATVVRCRYVAGHMHEVSVRFDEPVNEDQFISMKLDASILVVDDAEDHLRLTSHFLSKAGAEVVTANRGVRALKLIAEHDFDLVLLDVEMPGISGPQAAKALRDRGVVIPIIAYTASTVSTTREECLAAGCSEVLVKPLSKADLIDAVANFLAIEKPITSTHAGDPEMAEFIHDFVTHLPIRIEEMNGVLKAQNFEELGALARKLKVSASDEGGCGYGELSAAANSLVTALTGTVDCEAANEAMFILTRLSYRVKDTSE